MIENNIPETEQWKKSGNCSKCRRSAHCTNKCKAKKQREDYEFRAAVHKALSNTLLGRYL